MIGLGDARARLHTLIDNMPDDQVALVWMTFQSMFAGELDEDDEDAIDDGNDSDEDELDDLDRI